MMDLHDLDPLTQLAWTAMTGGNSPAGNRAWEQLCAPRSVVFDIARRAVRRACACHGWHYPISHPVVQQFLEDVPARLFQYVSRDTRMSVNAHGTNPPKYRASR